MLVICWLCVDYRFDFVLVIRWLNVGYGLVMGWLNVGCMLVDVSGLSTHPDLQLGVWELWEYNGVTSALPPGKPMLLGVEARGIHRSWPCARLPKDAILHRDLAVQGEVS